MARPRKFDEIVVLENIKGVFWERGYEATSFEDLIKASGLHKGSLYAAFGDKRSLYLRSISAYHENEVASAIALLKGEGTSLSINGLDRIALLLSAVVDAVEKNNDRRGCLLCNAAVDQAPHNKDVEDLVSKGLLNMKQAFEVALADVWKGTERREMASLVNSVYFGMRVMAKSGAPVSMIIEARTAALTVIGQSTHRSKL